MRQPLTDSELVDALDLYAQGTVHTSCDDACEQRNYCTDALAAIKQDRQDHALAARVEELETIRVALDDPNAKTAEDILEFAREAVDSGIAELTKGGER